MRRIALTAAFLFMSAFATAQDNVPYANPSHAGPGETDTTNLISLSDIMQETQWRHIKLWYAGQSGDWDLVRFEIDRVIESLRRSAILYRNIPIEDIKAASDPLVRMQAAVAKKDIAQFNLNYGELTAACNSCHRSAGVGFIRMQTPISSPFSDGVFGK